jgi:phospholipase/carboxylesterase
MTDTTGSSELPRRRGPRPATNLEPPHSQISQNSPPELQEELFERAKALPGVTVGRSLVSVPGARAFHLDRELANGPAEAFQAKTEFAHLHPVHDGSLHLSLPSDVIQDAIDRGWGELHPLAPGAMMVFGPRNREELEVVWRLVRASYRWARGESVPA